MDSKTLFEIQMPAVQTAFELWIPDDLTIGDATRLVCAVVEDQKDAWFKASRSTSLYAKSSGEELDINKRIRDFDFVNGSKLVLI
ncbi:MAG: hypothetical protein LBH87_02165 [Coriobacteriales bacterium]|jgi:hypothetical protein|nr:hypothetical protein [Coriobacteriales bacterium]